MAKPAPEYELVLMLDPEVPDERRDQIAVEARKRIEDAGDLKQERSWGLRKMAYEINQRTEADYRWYRFEAPPTVLEQLDHNLKIADGVLRFRIFKVDPDAPVMVPPATAAPPAGRDRSRDEAPPPPRQAAAAPEAEAEAPQAVEQAPEAPQPAAERASEAVAEAPPAEPEEAGAAAAEEPAPASDDE